MKASKSVARPISRTHAFPDAREIPVTRPYSLFLAAACHGGQFSAGASGRAGLFDRGGGLIYDDDLSVSWLRNAYDSGPLTEDQATTWAATLDYRAMESTCSAW